MGYAPGYFVMDNQPVSTFAALAGMIIALQSLQSCLFPILTAIFICSAKPAGVVCAGKGFSAFLFSKPIPTGLPSFSNSGLTHFFCVVWQRMVMPCRIAATRTEAGYLFSTSDIAEYLAAIQTWFTSHSAFPGRMFFAPCGYNRARPGAKSSCSIVPLVFESFAAAFTYSVTIARAYDRAIFALTTDRAKPGVFSSRLKRYFAVGAFDKLGFPKCVVALLRTVNTSFAIVRVIGEVLVTVAAGGNEHNKYPFDLGLRQSVGGERVSRPVGQPFMRRLYPSVIIPYLGVQRVA